MFAIRVAARLARQRVLCCLIAVACHTVIVVSCNNSIFSVFLLFYLHTLPLFLTNIHFFLAALLARLVFPSSFLTWCLDLLLLLLLLPLVTFGPLSLKVTYAIFSHFKWVSSLRRGVCVCALVFVCGYRYMRYTYICTYIYAALASANVCHSVLVAVFCLKRVLKILVLLLLLPFAQFIQLFQFVWHFGCYLACAVAIRFYRCKIFSFLVHLVVLFFNTRGRKWSGVWHSETFKSFTCILINFCYFLFKNFKNYAQLTALINIHFFSQIKFMHYL